ncbi:AAA family ATPase, partial [Aestuariivita boseongensis]|uniref:AAA family ATPase n=1 Tax=Aestuariivita boseongensis TaxID=1470562 RepID=UPI00155DA02F
MINNKSLVLIADDGEMTQAVSEAVGTLPDLTLETHEGTLTSVNGSAVQMLSQNDLVIFRLTGEQDSALVRHLRGQVGQAGRLLALSDRDISLSEARELRKSGVDEILPFPVGQVELTEQIERLAITNSMLPAIYKPGRQRLGHVIAVCPARGGIGASTLAINLADQLQGHSGVFQKSRANRVALVDLDVQFGTVATSLDLKPSPGLFKLAQEQKIPDQTFLRQCMQSHDCGLDVLAAPEEFMPPDAFSREQICALITALRRDYDYIVIDLPRSLSEWFGAIVSACDRMLMVTDSSVPSIRQSCRLID